MRRSPAEHLLRLHSNRHDLPGFLVYRHDRRLVYHYSLAPDVNEGVRRSQIDAYVVSKEIIQFFL